MPLDKEYTERMDAPPFLKSWPRVYGAIVIYLAFLLAALYLITKAFRY